MSARRWPSASHLSLPRMRGCECSHPKVPTRANLLPDADHPPSAPRTAWRLVQLISMFHRHSPGNRHYRRLILDSNDVSAHAASDCNRSRSWSSSTVRYFRDIFGTASNSFPCGRVGAVGAGTGKEVGVLAPSRVPAQLKIHGEPDACANTIAPAQAFAWSSCSPD